MKENLLRQFDFQCAIATNGDDARKFRCACSPHRGRISRKFDLVQPAPLWTALSPLSGATASAHPSPVNALFELLRTFVLAFVIARLAFRRDKCIEDSRRCFLPSWVLFKVDIRDSRMVSDQAIYLHLHAPLRPSLPAVKAIATVIH